MLPILSLWLAVSYSRDVAPVLAMHCNGCHGEAGGLSLRTYREIMAGGNLGKVVVPGDAEKSLIVHFVEGRRGPSHRMPPDGPPLSAEQIGVIRRWIADGAKEDRVPPRVWRRVLPSVTMDMQTPTHVRCKLDVPGYLLVTARGSQGEVLWHDAAAATKPGQPVEWQLRAGYDWPKVVRLELEIRYAASEPHDIEFSAAQR